MIDTIKDEELEIKKEDLLKNMKMLRRTVLDMFGSKSFFKGLIHEPQNGIITVNEEQFPVYISGNTLSIDSHPDITDDIFDAENYLSLLTDDDLMWYALVEHLAHQVELLQEDNNKYNDDLVTANEEIDNLNCKVAEEIKARRAYEEALKEANKQLSDPDTITSQSRMEDAYTKRVLELLGKIEELENDNKRLSEIVKTLVIEKSKLEKSDDDRTEKPASEIIKECVGDKVDLETATLLQENAKLNEEVQALKETSGQYIDRTSSLLQENYKLKEEIQSLKDYLRERISEYDRRLSVFKREKEEAELIAYRLTKGEMLVQFDNMKSLEHENGVLKDENADLNQKLWQNGYHITYSAHSAHSEEADVDNEDMQQTITQETMAELTARINELETKLKDKDECINQLSKHNSALSIENKNFGDLLKNADRDAKFYAREVDHLRQENDKIYSILNDAVKVVQSRNKQQQ